MQDTWPIDGTQHHDIGRQSIYLNHAITAFLDSDRKTILIAPKGMGKTLLLRAKKRILEGAGHGRTVIPRHQEYDDAQLHGSLPQSGLNDMDLWKDAWRAAIIFSILTHNCPHINETTQREIVFQQIDSLGIDEDFRSRLKHEISNSAEQLPSYYLSSILSRSVGAVRQFIRSCNHVDALSQRCIVSDVCLFIDGFDQTLTEKFPADLAVWRNAQRGLLRAIHRLNAHNRHIKVFVSVRQEAWAGFESDDREVIKGKAVLLEHNFHELRAMFEHAVRRYTTYTSSAELLGGEKIKNGWCGASEDSFQYLYRHSIGSARSIMNLGGRIHEAAIAGLSPEQREELVREKINAFGAENALDDYLLGQRAFFLKTLNSEDRVRALLRCLPSNVLSGRSLTSVAHEFARITGLDFADCHPFCELHNVGLLGTVAERPVDGKVSQHFNQPHEFSWQHGGVVHQDRTYLVHPSLHAAVIRERARYHLNPSNIIGHTGTWRMSGIRVFPLLFISHATADKPTIDKFLRHFEDTLQLTIPCEIWYDSWSIRVGGRIQQEIEHGVRGSELVLVFVSKESLKSGWVEKEWRAKHQQEIEQGRIRVLATIIDDTSPSALPEFLREKKAKVLRVDSARAFLKDAQDLARDIGEYLLESRVVQTSQFG